MLLSQDHYYKITFCTIIVTIELESNTMTIWFEIERCTIFYDKEFTIRRLPTGMLNVLLLYVSYPTRASVAGSHT